MLTQHHELQVGDFVPSFCIQDEIGNQFSEKDFLEKKTILYFYPKDGTFLCTKQACFFRDHFEQLKEMNISVIGVSSGSDISHQKFISKHQLPFKLLCDVNQELAKKFGLLNASNFFSKIKQALTRATFVIDPLGKIIWIEKGMGIDIQTTKLLKEIPSLF